MKKKTIGIAVLLLTIFLTGCAVGPDFKPPVVETPKNYRFEKVPVETIDQPEVVGIV